MYECMVLRRINERAFESSHGRGCTFRLKCFWAVELLTGRAPGQYDNFTRMMMLGLAHQNAGRVAPMNFVQAMSPIRYWAPHVRSSENSAAPLPWDDSFVICLYRALCTSKYIYMFHDPFFSGCCFSERSAKNIRQKTTIFGNHRWRVCLLYTSDAADE